MRCNRARRTSSAMPRLKHALSQVGRSATACSASARACRAFASFTNAALRLLSTVARSSSSGAESRSFSVLVNVAAALSHSPCVITKFDSSQNATEAAADGADLSYRTHLLEELVALVLERLRFRKRHGEGSAAAPRRGSRAETAHSFAGSICIA